MRLRGPIQERLRARTRTLENGCVVWTASVDRHGYGRIYFGGVNRAPHRVAYELERGPIPDGAQVDHLCKNPLCCNPDHLEAVTPRENTLRSSSLSAVNARKTHCNKGHPFDEANTYRRGGRRCCRACNRAAVAAYQKRVAK